MLGSFNLNIGIWATSHNNGRWKRHIFEIMGVHNILLYLQCTVEVIFAFSY
jgi:hypothetical protein